MPRKMRNPANKGRVILTSAEKAARMERKVVRHLQALIISLAQMEFAIARLERFAEEVAPAAWLEMRNFKEKGS